MIEQCCILFEEFNSVVWYNRHREIWLCAPTKDGKVDWDECCDIDWELGPDFPEEVEALHNAGIFED